MSSMVPVSSCATGIVMTLSASELLRASTVGVRRRIGAIFRGNQARYGASKGWERTWAMDIAGAAGEFAAAKALGAYWTASLDVQAQEPDLWLGNRAVEVRTASMSHWRLIINPNDHDTVPYVLVLGVGPEFNVRGWLFAGEAKRNEWWGYTTDPSRPCFLVPQDSLRPTATLKGL